MAAKTGGDVFRGVPLTTPLPPGLADAEIRGLDYDSRRIGPGFLFFAFPGAKADGRQFVLQAKERGAMAVVSQSPAPTGWADPWVQVAHGRRALAECGRNYYGAPDEAVYLTGVTGTNGKTTVTTLIDSLLQNTGKITGLIGTIEYRVANEVRPAANTTPESLDILRLLDDVRQRGGTHVTMEVSSHALALGRVYGLHYRTAVFTNLTRDHLDFHGTMDAYLAAKQLLFTPADRPAPDFAILNEDDDAGRNVPTAAGTRRIGYAIDRAADLRALHLEQSFDGLRFAVQFEGQDYLLHSPLVGRINVYNLLAAFGAGLAFGMEPERIAEALGRARAVPGRFERVQQGQPFLVVVDYAHTDDAIRNVIRAGRDLSPRRVITLFGCGGDRDRTKRPLMAAAAAEGSDLVVLTSDNPRSEDPQRIIEDALPGLVSHGTPYQVEPDRAIAIGYALSQAQPGDLVLLAGKGHETYQIIGGQTIAFDDREVARQALQAMGYCEDGR